MKKTDQASFLDAFDLSSIKKQEKGPVTAKEAKDAYYNTGHPLISDSEYDRIKQKNETVGAPVPDNRPKKKLYAPMLSLKNSYSMEETKKFIESFLSATNDKRPCHAVVLEDKIDGLSCELIYKTGQFASATTRGNGEEGEDITETVRNLPSVPKNLPTNSDLVIRGELECPKEKFDSLNREMIETGRKPYTTPRNTASGLMRDNDPLEAGKRGISFIAFEIVNPETERGLYTHADILDYLRIIKFRTPRHCTIRGNSAEEITNKVEDAVEKLLSERETLAYDIDGVVIKTSTIADQATMGTRGTTPRWAIARKPKAKSATTKLKNIIIQTGATGVLTPVAVLDPVVIGGVTITSATLHNAQEIKRMDIRIGDTIILERAGDVIPYIVGVCSSTQNRGAPWIFPDKCPSCSAQAVLENETGIKYVCSNATECPGTLVARLTRIVSRDFLNIDGLGDEAIKQFCDMGWLKQTSDLYNLPEKIRNHSKIPGWGERKTKSLENSLRKASELKLYQVILAMEIRHLGRSLSRKSAQHFKNITALLEIFEKISQGDKKSIESFQSIPDAGPSVTENISEWFRSENRKKEFHQFLQKITIKEEVENNTTGILSGKTIIFTGTMISGSRTVMENNAKSLGAAIASSISGSVNILVYGDKAGSKLEKAKSINEKKPGSITILTEEQWIERTSKK